MPRTPKKITEDIHINKTYSIGADELNVILYEHHIVTGGKGIQVKEENIGKDQAVVLGYFSTAENALHYMVEHDIKKTQFKSFEEIVAKIQELHTAITNLIGQPLPTLR